MQPTPNAHACTQPAPGNFTHTPRPAIVPTREGHTTQRRFGSGKSYRDYNLQPADREARAVNSSLEVYRDSECDLAEVTLSLGNYTCASITARLNPAELRELAARLIDAAHDIDTLPAAVLVQAQEGSAT